MVKVEINKETCKGCELCAGVCPLKILEMDNANMNGKGYYPATVVNQDKCAGCANCALICPDSAISVIRI